MDLRHEWKHEINLSDMTAIRQRLRAVAYPDSHAVDGKYFIRSLYFDDLYDTALREKIAGVNRREKFRIRYYNRDKTLIHLEKKSKFNGLGSKASAVLTEQQALDITNGDIDELGKSEQPLLRELYSKMRYGGLRPKTIVDYTREPFIFPAGNVRVTLDYDIRTGLACTDFLNTECVTIPAANSPIILEVKWDAYLPDIIKDAVQLEGRHTSSFSKYEACRLYG
ncbi:MAG: polyphosphate polymerase domain-containing protein [Ruminiclostridium sp.]|nr:polyphosphate polymerase domain-containing protein [Ruminiclostridium sp.]